MGLQCLNEFSGLSWCWVTLMWRMRQRRSSLERSDNRKRERSQLRLTGQACIGPDYILTTPDTKPKLIAELQKAIDAQGDLKNGHPTYERVISKRHFELGSPMSHFSAVSQPSLRRLKGSLSLLVEDDSMRKVIVEFR